MTTFPTIIDITAKHITDGSRKNACKCPVALAIRELCPGARVAVSATFVVIDGVVHALPVDVQNFIASIDRGERHIIPLQFHLA